MAFLKATLLVLCIGMIATGIILIFNLFGRAQPKVRKKKTDGEENTEITNESETKKSIASTVNYYEGKISFFDKEQNTARDILLETGQSQSELTRTFMKCAICSAIGVVVGWLFNQNYILMAVLGAGLFFIPLWRLKLYRNKYRKYLSSQLESCVTLITTSYIRSGDIISAVSENLDDLSPIIRPYFEDFLTESAVNPSIKNCVRNLRDRINNSVFKQWCQTLIRTLDNSEMREALIPIAKKYSDIRIVQEQIDLETHQAIIEYIVMMVMDVCVYPLIYVLNKDWWSYYSTFLGKCIIAFTFLVVLYCIAKLIDISQPVEYRI